MNNKMKMIIIVVVIIAVIAGVIGFMYMNKNDNENNTTNDNTTQTTAKLEPVTSAEDLTKLVDKIYEGEEDLFPSIQTQEIDVSDKDMVSFVTGLEDNTKLEYLVVSEPMMSSQAYSLVLAKVKDGVNANEVAKEISEKIDTRKWICVSAEQLYATNSGDVVFMVMTNKKLADSLYGNFKTLAGEIGQTYEKYEAQ